MAYVVAAPEDHVVADRDEGLDHVVLEDEAVSAYFDVGPHERLAADVAGQLVSKSDRSASEASAKPVELGVDHRHVDRVLLWVELLGQGLEVDDGQALQGVTLAVLSLDRERHRLVV